MITHNNIARTVIFLMPILFILGSPSINLFLIIGSFLILHNILKKKIIIHENWILLFTLFWVYLILISFFSENILSALRAGFSQIRFLLFSLFIGFYFDFRKNYKRFFFIWKIILVGVSIDVCWQFFNGINFLGFPAEHFVPGVSEIAHIARLGGVFNEELVVGAFISKLSYPLIFYMFSKLSTSTNSIKILYILIISLLFTAVFMSGERLSLFIICSALFFGSLILLDVKKTLTIFSVLFILSALVYEQNRFLKTRVIETAQILLNIPSSSYGRIYQSSIEVWKKNWLVGSGLKNYHNECVKLIDKDKIKSKFAYCSPTHSHNILLQIMSETGTIGLILFILLNLYLLRFLYKKYQIKKFDLDKESKATFIGCYAYILITLFPFITSGSFFTTWNATFFWLHIGLAFSILNIKKIKN
jgi:O-antigen ligase